MEPYVEMLINGGCWTSYEIHECDYGLLRDGLRWEEVSDDFQSERYYDTFDRMLPKYAWLSDTKKIDFLLWSKRG